MSSFQAVVVVVEVVKVVSAILFLDDKTFRMIKEKIKLVFKAFFLLFIGCLLIYEL